MSKVNLKFHFKKSNVEKLNLKLINLYRRIMVRFVFELKQLQPNIKDKKINGKAYGINIIEIDSPLQFNYIISNTKPYASYFETGTGIYGPKGEMITPKYEKVYVDKTSGQAIVRVPYALHWMSGGNNFFAKSVRGIKPTNPFTTLIKQKMRMIVKEVMTSA